MADEADLAAEYQAAEIEHGVARTLAGGPFPRLRPTGFCHWCGEPVLTGATHCRPIDDSCAEDHAQFMRYRGESPR